MSSITSFLDNSIVNNTIRLFLILYAGYIYKVDSTYLHTFLNQKLFSITFITLVMFALTRKFWFSLILTVLFYAFFHFLTAIESKRSYDVQIITPSQPVNLNQALTMNSNNKKSSNESEYDSDSDSEENDNVVTNNISKNESIDKEIKSEVKESWNKMQQFINLQTDNSFEKPGETKFIDISMKKEYIQPHNSFEVKMGKF